MSFATKQLVTSVLLAMPMATPALVDKKPAALASVGELEKMLNFVADSVHQEDAQRRLGSFCETAEKWLGKSFPEPPIQSLPFVLGSEFDSTVIQSIHEIDMAFAIMKLTEKSPGALPKLDVEFWDDPTVSSSEKLGILQVITFFAALYTVSVAKKDNKDLPLHVKKALKTVLAEGIIGLKTIANA